MPTALRLHTPSSHDEMSEIPWLLSHAFGSPEAEAAEWMKRHEPKNVRVVREGDRTLASLFLIPMGQFFGGRSVPMIGVAGVAVSPEARGRGVATTLMRETIAELHGQGVPLSGLYPATQPLYRRAGYEMAGHRFRIVLKARSMQVREPAGRELLLRQATGAWNGEGDHRRIREFYRAQAVHSHGAIDRTELMWERIVNPRGNATKCFVVERSGEAGAGEGADGGGAGAGGAGSAGGGGAIEGYLYLWMERLAATNTRIIHITDMQACTPEAGRRLLGFIADHRSLNHEAEWFAGPVHPLLTLLGEQHYEITKQDFWMLRIVDVPRALRARGYNPLVKARLDLHVADDLIEANSGAWTLRVEEGRASAERGSGGGRAGGPAATLSVRALAMLYGGLLTPWQMRAAGLLAGGDEAMHAAAVIFGGDGAAWMTEMF